MPKFLGKAKKILNFPRKIQCFPTPKPNISYLTKTDRKYDRGGGVRRAGPLKKTLVSQASLMCSKELCVNITKGYILNGRMDSLLTFSQSIYKR